MKALPLLRQSVQTSSRNEMVDVTDRLKKLIVQYNLTEAMLIVYVPHTTAAVTINENADPDVRADVIAKLADLIPKEEGYYRHGEGNSDSHVKTSLVGNSVTVLIEKGKLVLGQWQGVYLCEFDGPREREFDVKIVRFDSTGRD